jgi:hypothetical protein
MGTPGRKFTKVKRGDVRERVAGFKSATGLKFRVEFSDLGCRLFLNGKERSPWLRTGPFAEWFEALVEGFNLGIEAGQRGISEAPEKSETPEIESSILKSREWVEGFSIGSKSIPKTEELEVDVPYQPEPAVQLETPEKPEETHIRTLGEKVVCGKRSQVLGRNICLEIAKHRNCAPETCNVNMGERCVIKVVGCKGPALCEFWNPKPSREEVKKNELAKEE